MAPASVTERSLGMRDGCTIWTRLYPQRGQPRLLLIHSLGLDSSIWEHTALHLAGDFEILLYDCRGHGRSEKRPGPYTLQLFADDAVCILEQYGWAKTYVAGCAMGGAIAQSLADAAPSMLIGLALIDTTAFYDLAGSEQWKIRAKRAKLEGFASLLPEQEKKWFTASFKESNPHIANHLNHVFLRNDVECYAAACNMLATMDLRVSSSRISIPTVIAVGQENVITPVAMATQLQSIIRESRLEILDTGKHLAPVQSPKQIATLIRSLLHIPAVDLGR